MASNDKLDCIYTILLPVHKLSMIAGLFVLSNPKNDEQGKRRKSKVTSINNITRAIILIITIVCATTFICVYRYCNYEKIEDRIEHIHLIQISITLLTAIILLFISAFKLEKGLNEIISIISEFDEVLKTSDNMYVNNGKTIKTKIIYLVAVFVILFVLDVISCYLNVICHFFTIVMDYTVFLHFIVISQYIAVVFLVKERFQMINNNLILPEIVNTNIWSLKCDKLGLILMKKMKSIKFLSKDQKEYLHTTENHTWNNINLVSQTEYFQKQRAHFKILRIAYETLCTVVSMINNLFGFQILLSIITLFTEITSNFYHAIRVIAISTNITALTVEIMFCGMCWSLQYLLILLSSTRICDAAVGQVNEICISLQRLLLIENLHPDSIAEIQLFIQQIVNRKVKFTAWGFFTIDSKLMGSIIGAVTTLLVILVQFHKIV